MQLKVNLTQKTFFLLILGLVTVVLAVSGIALVSHKADQVKPGAFGAAVGADLNSVYSFPGKVGIGVANPSFGLEVAGGANLNNTLFVNATTANVGVGISNPTEKLHVIGNIFKTGTASFVEQHPLDSTKQIVYISLEGPEAGTYIRGTASCKNKEAVVILPEYFTLVTSPNGLTAYLAPRSQSADLFIKELTNSYLVVGCSRDVAFDYFVSGIRAGYENYQTVQNK